MTVEVLTLFYGERHLEMLFKTLIPSLWRKSNIPAMLKDGAKVVHRIYCPPAEAQIVSLYAAYSDIPVEIITSLRADHEWSRHEGLYRCVQEQIKRGTLTVMANCDHVFGNGLWNVIKDLKPGDYLVCGHPRTNYESGFVHMEDLLKQDDPENRALVTMALERHPHHIVIIGKRERNPYWRVVRKDGFWEGYFGEPPPLAWWSVPDMLEPWTRQTVFGPWEVIDHDLPQHARERNRLKLITDSRQFFWTEFTSQEVYTRGIGTCMNTETMFFLHTIPLYWYT